MVPPDISRKSQAAASTHPPASAWPLIAATTGFGQLKTASSASLSAGRNSATYAGPPSTIRFRSTPAEKHRPAPVRTTAGASTAANTPGSAESSSRSAALTGPWASVTTATPSCSEVSITKSH